MAAPQPTPDRTLQMVVILRRILLFAVAQLERWLAREGVFVRKPVRLDDDEA